MTKTRGLTRDELVTMACYYVHELINVDDAKATEETAQDLIDAAIDSMLGREDVPELRQEDGDIEIVVHAIEEAVANRRADESE